MSFQTVAMRALRLLADTEQRKAIRARNASGTVAVIERQIKGYLNDYQCTMPDSVAEVLCNARDRVQFKREQYDAREAEATASMIEAEQAAKLANEDTASMDDLNRSYASQLADRRAVKRIA